MLTLQTCYLIQIVDICISNLYYILFKYAYNRYIYINVIFL